MNIWDSVEGGFGRCGLILAICLMASPSPAQVTRDWVATYGGSGPEISLITMTVDSAGNVYNTGIAPGAGGYDFLTIKYSPNGNTIWAAKYDGPAHGSDWPLAIKVDAIGNVFVGGYSPGIGTGNDYVVVKYGPSGNQLWVSRYDGPAHTDDQLTALVLDEKGNAYVTGASNEGIFGEWACTTIKYDANGGELWVKRYRGPLGGTSGGIDLKLDASGNLFVAGGTGAGGNNRNQFATIKYDSNGNQIWDALYDSGLYSWDEAKNVALDAAGNVYVGGYSTLDEFGNNPVFRTIKYSPSGQQLWTRTRSGVGDALAADSAGNSYITGHAKSTNNTWDIVTVKYDTTGAQVYSNRFNGPANYDDDPREIAVDPTGNAYVVGGSNGVGTDFDFLVLKYGPTGEQLWMDRYDKGHDRGWAIDLDDTGHVYIAGSPTFSNGSEYTTIKYSQEPGFDATSYVVAPGSVVSGNIASLSQNDDDRLVVRPGPVLVDGESPLDLVITGIAPASTPSVLKVVVESSATSTVEQIVEVRNYSTGLWQQLDQAALVRADVTRVYWLPSPASYIGPGNEVMIRLRFRTSVPVLVYPWLARVDEASWRIIQ